MNRHLTKFRAIALGLVAASAMAQSGDPSSPSFKFSGFGSLAATKSSEKNADFTAITYQPSGPGFTRSVDLGVDSRLGAQLDVKFGDLLSGVFQATSDRRYDDTFTPGLSMAFLKLQLANGLDFRVGRLPYNAYLISDYRKVGYSMPWVRPPVEVYYFNPFTYVDGADIGFRHNLGDVAFHWQLMSGSSDVDMPGGTGGASGVIKQSGTSLSVSATHGFSTYRAYYVKHKVTFDIASLNSAFAMLRNPNLYGPGVNPLYNPALADQYEYKDKLVTYTSLGYSYDPGGWFVMGEVARNAGDDFMLVHATAGYLTTGIRLGAWTPSFTAAERRNDSPITHPHPVIAKLIANTNRAQTSMALGLRWDFHLDWALKLQFDRVRHDQGSRGAMTNQQPAFKTGQSYNLATIALDFVF